MNHNKFKKELLKIKKFLEFTDWEFSYQFEENSWFVAECTSIDYKRFQANFTFANKLLTESDDFIKKVIMHEFCHIFTIMNLRQFSEDEYLKNQLWWNSHAEIIVRMDILNEQMTVRLEKILSKYLWQIKKIK